MVTNIITNKVDRNMERGPVAGRGDVLTALTRLIFSPSNNSRPADSRRCDYVTLITSQGQTYLSTMCTPSDLTVPITLFVAAIRQSLYLLKFTSWLGLDY